MVLFCIFFFLFSFIIVILNYSKVDYKVFIIRNNKLIYLSRIKSCLWGWSYYHYSLAQRPISHRIHMFLATLSIICKCGILGIGCVSIWCTSGRGLLFQASATYRRPIDCLFEIRKIAVCFLWLSLPGDYRITDKALLAETT